MVSRLSPDIIAVVNTDPDEQLDAVDQIHKAGQHLLFNPFERRDR